MFGPGRAKNIIIAVMVIIFINNALCPLAANIANTSIPITIIQKKANPYQKTLSGIGEP